MEIQSDLPALSPAARTHSRLVTALIRERIEAAGGWIDFSDYMQLALYAPGAGYYSAGARKFGADGDFVTAPEISSLFSRCLARSIADILRDFSSPVILELGAGTGAMAADALRALEALKLLPARYLILEISADLRARQEETLKSRVPDLLGRVEWLDALPDEPIEGVILANEVLDALSFTRFEIGRDGLLNAGVGLDGNAFRWSFAPASTPLRDAVQDIELALSEPFPAAYSSEWCASLPAFIGGLSAALAAGAILLIDYGLPRRERYHRDRSAGTLMCHYRHRAHANPFIYPGLQDITAWVDFTAVAEAAVAAGLEVCGYTTQAQYLLAAGIDIDMQVRGEELSSDSAAPGVRTQLDLVLARELKLLTLPGEMGEKFKVMGLRRGIGSRPAGFAGRDLRHLL